MRWPLRRSAPVNRRLAYALLIVLGLLLDWRFADANRSGWGVDFNQFYAASHLAGSGQLYDWNALQQEERKHGLTVHTARLPVVAYGVKAVSGLPYETAQRVWLILSAAALIGAVIIWPGGSRPAGNKAVLFMVLAWSWPAVLLLLLGQDTPFWLLFFAAGFALFERRQATLAGIVLALCLCKFHLAAGIPIILMARRAWRTLAAGALTTALLLGACFLIEGPGWPARYFAVVNNPLLSPAAEHMPNLRGIVSGMPKPFWIQVALAFLLATCLWRATRKCADVGIIAALGAACGLLLAPHGYANDCVLLIPLIGVCLSDKSAAPWLRVWALVMLSPLALLTLASDKPLAGQLMIAGFVAAALFKQILFKQIQQA